MSADTIEDIEATHQSKEFLKNLGKRPQCFLQIMHKADPSGNGVYNTMPVVVDDVGAPVANVKSYKIEHRQGEGAVLTLEITNVSLQVTTR